MAIALCISGHFRNFEITWPSLKQYVIDIYKPDIFAHAWNDTFGNFMHKKDTSHISHILGYDPNSGIVSHDYINLVAKRLLPKSFKSQNPKNIEDFINQQIDSKRDYEPTWEFHRPRSKYQMLYSRTQCINLKKEYEIKHKFTYDKVILTRWDIIYENQLPGWLTCTDKLLIPRRYGYRGPSDVWACGSSKQIDVFGTMFDQYDEVKKIVDFTLDPHLWLKNHLDFNNIQFIICEIPIMIANRPFE